MRILPPRPGEVSLRLRFLDFVLDAGARALSQGERRLHLTPKALDLLVLLAAERPRVVAKAEILDRVWAGTFVTDASVARTIHEIRDALGAAADTTIRTAHGLGYAFVAEAVDADPAPPAGPAKADGRLATRGWLVDGTRASRLVDGEMLIGRDPGLPIALACTQTSWHHARLVVARDATTIEDLASKNGTVVRGRRLAGRTVLRDGDTVDIGTARFVYRKGAAHPATSTKG